MRNNTSWPDDEDDESKTRHAAAREQVYLGFPHLRPPPPAKEKPRDPFITRAAAAKLLGVTERTVYRHLARGRLRPCVRGAAHGILREDVDALLGAAEDELPLPVNRRTITRLHRELLLLRHDVERCHQVLNMRFTPLTLSTEELVERYRAAASQASTGPAPGSIDSWIEFLLRLREEDLLEIEKATGAGHPWIPFHALVGKLWPSTPDELIRSRRCGQLSAAKQNIETLVYVWLVKMYGEDGLQRRIEQAKVAAQVAK